MTQQARWIYQHLANNPEDGTLIYRELPGNHYQPVGYDTGDRDLVNEIIDCLEELKMSQSGCAHRKASGRLTVLF
jgi:hypothetical protein